ncbi:protein RGF1 INDUCIBLE TRANSCRIPTION FACTOR 1-like [Henckelia pumila]|uniref:protein RGF1 INDUCIBLE TRANSCRIPTION FACTOR 1-like n=1 Tax=Henckelia pumila TaxID=405737 RepID=UPI003C6E28A0
MDATMPPPDVPPWLEKLLATAFFTACHGHGAAARSECNMFCLDCSVDDSFCPYCRSSKHTDHRVIQIRRSSYHDVVRVSEIQKVLDINGVQTYVINSARVLFLNQRPQPKVGKTSSHVCETCGRSLLDPFRFCSLGCKFVGMRNIEEGSFTLEGKNVEVVTERRLVSSSKEEEEEEESRDAASQQDIYPPPTPPPPPSRSRRRKGIPQRAPFSS